MPVAASQIRAVLSQDPVATLLPSGDQATLLTTRPCPSSARTSSPVVASQIRAVLSQDPVATRLPSGDYPSLAEASGDRDQDDSVVPDPCGHEEGRRVVVQRRIPGGVVSGSLLFLLDVGALAPAATRASVTAPWPYTGAR